jgi:peptidoglycan/xylan/chitin deacetylase (PgdA/CDA1 family)
MMAESPWQPRRDFVGYGANPPDPKWPAGARLAVNFVMNYEEGAEPSIQDGDGFTELGLTEAPGVAQLVKGRDLSGESMFEYGSRVAFWRLMGLFQERQLPMTVFACALGLERNVQAAQAIRDAGHDVCSHGWRWVRPTNRTEDEERDDIARSVASLTATMGERPLGWYSRYGPSVHTRRLLAAEGGFLYDSDSYADELPFWQTVEGRPHLVIPYSLTTNDGKFAGPTGTSTQWFEFVRDAFDVLYREGSRQPKMMSIGFHMRVLGHPSRSAALERVLDHIMRHEGVWVTRRLDIASHWRNLHPFDGRGLNE